MERKETVIIILLAALLTVSVGFGAFFGVSAYLHKTDASLGGGSDSVEEEGADQIGKVVSIGSDYLSIELYTAENPEAEVSYETLSWDTLTSAGENRFVILHSDAKAFHIENGERKPETVKALSIGDCIAVTLDENGVQNILRLSRRLD